MDDLDELLYSIQYKNPRENEAHKAFSSEASASSTSSISSTNSNHGPTSNDLISSISRLVNENNLRNELKEFNSMKRGMNFNNILKPKELEIGDDFYADNLSLDSMNSSDLAELDNLLEDLSNAKKDLAQQNSQLNSSSNSSYLKSDSSPTESCSYSPLNSPPDSRLTRQSETNPKILDIKRPSISKSDRSAITISQAERELTEIMNSLSINKNPDEFHTRSENRIEEAVDDEIPIIPISIECKSKLVGNNVCHGCSNPINGQVITALGYLWHPDHFTCFHCKKKIGTSIFYEKSNHPYCETDYLELFSPKCHACTKPILDKMLTALNKSWHLNCFQCNSCHKMLNDESFMEIENSAYCKECYVSELAPKCKRCSSPIMDNFISALDGYFHPSCFVCAECGCQFVSSSFYEFNSMPYCEIHYHLKRGSLCGNCEMPINGRCITALNKKFHPEHFTCSFCLKQLSKCTFKEQNEKPYCHPCFSKLFP